MTIDQMIRELTARLDCLEDLAAEYEDAGDDGNERETGAQIDELEWALRLARQVSESNEVTP